MMFGVNILAYVFLLILRTRFPAQKSIASIIRERYGNPILKLQRKLESVDTKLRKAKLDLEFLNNCRDNGLIPHFLDFRLANNRLRRSDSYSIFQRRLLEEEIRSKLSSIRHLSNHVSTISQCFRDSVSLLDFIHVTSKLSRSIVSSLAQQQGVQERKFERLLSEKARTSVDPSKVIFNLSSHVLSPAQKKLLSRGLNFALPPRKLSDHDYLTPFELLYRSVMGLSLCSGSHQLLKTRLKDTALTSFHAFNSAPSPQVLTRAETTALKELSAVPNLVIQKSDKGNSVVLLDVADYNSKMQGILSDRSKFRRVCFPPEKTVLNHMFTLEDRITRVLTAASKRGAFSKQEFDRLSPSGSLPGKLYGLCKVHKPDFHLLFTCTAKEQCF